MQNRNRIVRILAIAGVLCLVTVAGGSERGIALKSGVVAPDAGAVAPATASPDDLQRWVVRFQNAPGVLERGHLQAAGARIDTPLNGQAFVVSVPGERALRLAQIPGVDWSTPYLPQHKIAPDVAGAHGDDTVIVLLHLFKDADAEAVASELSAAGYRIDGSGDGARFDRIVMRMTGSELQVAKAAFAERNDVFWVGRRYRRTLSMDDVVWVDQSGLEAGMTTPIHDHGIHGEGQIGAVLDTGIDADNCQFRDDTLGLPPTNTAGGTNVDLNQRKVIAVDFLDPTEDPSNPNHWDTQGHGTHVTGIFGGDDLATPIEHDTDDGMATGAQFVIQDAGYAADDCGDLPGIGCPVTDLVPVFQQAYDQGARVHNNSWNDNENAAVQNNYTDASEDVDEFMWNNPDFLIAIAVGNNVLGGYATMGSPSTAKNCVTAGGTFNGTSAIYLSDISAWGPTDDGRIKPDVLSPSASIGSSQNDGDVTSNNCTTNGGTGTSYASPAVSGGALMIRQYFQEGWYPTGAPNGADGFTPSAALMKAMLMNSAVAIEFDAEGRPISMPGIEQGWGRILLDNSMHFDGDTRHVYVDEHAGFSSPSDAPISYLIEVVDASEPFKVTLAWTDYPSTPANTKHLINDLDLRVEGDSGSYWGNAWRFNESTTLGEADRLNNVEQVMVEVPAPGTYAVQIRPHEIPQGPQPFALVVTGALGGISAGPRPGYYMHSIDDSGPNGNGDGVLDPGETARIPITLHNAGDADATSVIGQMFSSDPNLRVYGQTASFPDIPVDDTGNSVAPHFEVTMQPGAECGQYIGANMDISGDGFLVGSGLTFETGVYAEDFPSTDTPITIPKSSPDGVYSRLAVNKTFDVTEVDVTVNIDHEDIGQIRVVLYSPQNDLVILHDYSDAGTSGIHTTYDDITLPATGTMETFVGTDPQGTWRLRVQDNDGGGGVPDGTLQNWTLHFKSDFPFNCHPVGCSQGVPPAVGDTLHVEKSGASDTQVTWNGVGGASEYNVWRSYTKQFNKASHVGSTSGTSFIDAGAQNLPGAHYYLVRSVNTCGWESP